MIIAIDGPSASGKSTAAKLVAKELGFEYLDTGAMYRMITFAFLEAGGDSSNIDHNLLSEVLGRSKINLESGKFYLNNVDVSKEIRSTRVTNSVSDIAAVKEVRVKLVDDQRKLSESKDVILDGRDIGTVVFPDAELKLYLVASAEVRAERRLKDFEAHGETRDLQVLVEEIKLRDKKDSERDESPLRKADGAIEINTDQITIEQMVEQIVKEFQNIAA